LRIEFAYRRNGTKIAGMPIGKPFIADVTWRMKRESLGRELVVDLPDEWLEWRALEP
jgi:hypothetical protein